MSIPVNVGGVWRDSHQQQVCVNNVWRNTEQWGKVNGIWRKPVDDIRIILPEDIVGFHIIYKLCKSRVHERYPKLQFNPNVPCSMVVAGEQPIGFDIKAKSALFRYTNDKPEIEGNFMYEGHIYAELLDSSLICISDMYDSPISLNTGNISVEVFGYTLYEYEGPYVTGWNSFFSREINLPNEEFTLHKNIYKLNSYSILPTYSRLGTFDSVALIGISRNTTSRKHNMVGSYGILDHTIEEIRLNGVTKPFDITIYE